MSDTHLQVVDTVTGELRDIGVGDHGAVVELNDIPAFEGNSVAGTKAQITSVSALEIADKVFKLDEIVKIVVEARVQNIQHKVNQTSGKLERVHTLKAVDVVVLDWEMDLDDLRDEL